MGLYREGRHSVILLKIPISRIWYDALESVPLTVQSASGAIKHAEFDMSKIIKAAKEGRTDLVRALLAQEPGLVGAQGAFGESPLHFAAIGGHVELARLLLSNNADVEARAMGGGGPLTWAIGAKEPKIEMVKLLLDAGADVNPCIGRWTPLHGAAKRGSKEILELLIARGAKVNARSNLDCRTPLAYAAEAGRKDAVLSLLAAGAEVGPYDWVEARKKGHIDLEPILAERSKTAKERSRQFWSEWTESMNSKYGEPEDENSTRTSTEMLNTLHRRLCNQALEPKSAEVTLLCPECHAPLRDYSCAACGCPRMLTAKKVASATGGLAYHILQTINAIIFPVIGSVLAKDLAMEKARTDSSNSNEILLARLYESSPETYDQAAVCYAAWLATAPSIGGAAEVAAFIQKYSEHPASNPEILRWLRDVAFVRACSSWSEYAKRGDIIRAAFDGSEAQVDEARFFVALEALYRSAGRNTESMRGLVAWLSEIGFFVPDYVAPGPSSNRKV
jgi:ankyrin repeat protein